MAKIDTSGWQRFHLYDDGLFDIDMGTKLDRVKMTQASPDVNFVGRANANNGITARVDSIASITPYDAGNLTLSLGGEYLGSCFIQPDRFYTSQNVVVLIPKWNMPFGIKQFIATMIFRESRQYYKAFIDELNRHIKTDFSFSLPVNVDGEPDWAYMDAYMSEVMKESEARVESMRQADGDKCAVDTSGWKEFKLTDIFRMNNTKSIVQKDIVPDSGAIPYVTAQAGNNGVLTYIDCPPEWLDEGNCIMIGGKTLTFSFQEKAFCSNDSHNIALHLKDDTKASKVRYLFLIAALRGALYQKYSWGDSVSMNTIKDDTFRLPVNAAGEPDWAYMDEYMRTIMEGAKADLAVMQSIK